MDPSSLHIYGTKNQQKWTRGEKVTGPRGRKSHFYQKKNQSNSSLSIFEPLKKSLNITLLPLELLQDDLYSLR
jgi:hypothetical protein